MQRCLVVQIFLGGWVSSNDTGLACTGCPICWPGWRGQWAFAQAFNFWQDTNTDSFEYDALNHTARATIHITYRSDVLLALVLVGSLCAKALLSHRGRFHRYFVILLGALLLLQIELGSSNVVFDVPISIAVAHTLGALQLPNGRMLFLHACLRPLERRAPT